MAGRPSGGRSDLAKIVEKQMRNWELSRSQQHKPKPTEPAREVEDFVTISRMVGAGGRQTAMQLGERLDWPVFDREILQTMAGDDQVRTRLYEWLDERDLGWIEDTLRWLLEGEFRKDDYFRRLSETVLAIARQGRAIFLGRGADLLLPRERGLRVHLVASREVCVHRLAQRNNISDALASAEVDRIHRERTDFVRGQFGTAAAEITRHDLMLNTERFSTPEVVELICHALRVRGVIT